ncbi:hypothetical protein PROFUN_13806 [Planoprotostelium fungivorum]|uniref:Ankyrin repeat protein n=1 Tax=Planoprotostelium fungivorum TaxID=1890364 RepID=A0A2P6N2X3_9EUKA|nr:hypothetical protein PROFUN_13806 [Planoprotostelium fungivorum]
MKRHRRDFNLNDDIYQMIVTYLLHVNHIKAKKEDYQRQEKNYKSSRRVSRAWRLMSDRCITLGRLEPITSAVMHENMEALKHLLVLRFHRWNPSTAAIDSAICYKKAHVMEVLLEHPSVDPSSNDNVAIRTASRAGAENIVRLLLMDNEPVRFACLYGRSLVLSHLLQDARVNPAVRSNLCIREAAAAGHTEIVSMLMRDERVDATACDHMAARMAERNGHVQTLRKLVEESHSG